MQVVFDKDKSQLIDSASIATIGTYDGIHHGHRRVIAEVVKRAAASGHRSVVVSFDRHPLSIVRPDLAPLRLTTLEEKIELVSSLDVDLLYLVTFDVKRSLQEARDFVQEVLVDALKIREVHVGADFRFGHGRKGDINLLAQMGEEANFQAIGVDLSFVREVLGEGHPDAEKPISSSLIRTYISKGNVSDAAKLLHREHVIRGVVVGGDKRGGPELGFPTANLEVPEGMTLPMDGIYSGRAHMLEGNGGKIAYPAAISVGTRPTFYRAGGARLIESFILDFNGDLYGKEVELSFTAYLRPQITYESMDELRDQIALDVRQVRDQVGLIE